MEVRDKEGDILEVESEYSLLFRPVGLEALVGGVIQAMEASDGSLRLDEALYLANQIDWRVSDKAWGGTIVQYDNNNPAGKKIQAGRAAVSLASQLVAYRIGGKYMDDAWINDFKKRYLNGQMIPESDIEGEGISYLQIVEEQAEDLPI